MGKKTIDFKTRSDALRGRKLKAEGRKNQKRLDFIQYMIDVIKEIVILWSDDWYMLLSATA